MIPASALYAVAASVLMHVAWNLAARRADPRSFFLWWASLAALCVIGPWSILALIREAPWSAPLFGLLMLSMVAETLYFTSLGTAYRHAPVPLVYPIARSSPVLIAMWMALFFGERLPAQAWAGILISIAGVLTLAWTARGTTPARAIPWALAAALGTSVYSISNKFAVDRLPSYAAILGWASITLAAAWAGLSLQHRRQTGRWVPPVRPSLLPLVVAGVFIGNAYALLIHAMRYIPAAHAVALSNAGIVLAAILAMTWFREREHWPTRLAAVTVVCVGLALLASR